MTRRTARVTQADIQRAIRAAKQAGPNMAVEISPAEGVIRITPAATSLPESPPAGEEEVIPL